MTTLQDRVVEAVSRLVLDHLADRGSGHCLQIGHLPANVADAACGRTYADSKDEQVLARFVVETPQQPWHATPTKIVELRNHVDERDMKLAVFVAAGDSLAVEDSIGESTFEIVHTADLYRGITQELRNELADSNPELAERAEVVVDCTIGDARFHSDDESVAAFMSRLVSRPESGELGHALPELALLPDATLPDLETTEFKARLIRNAQQMAALVEPTAPVERLRRLPLDPAKQENGPILDALRNAIGDGTLDAGEIALRLDEPEIRAQVDFARWDLAAATAVPDEFRILQLVGDLSGEAEPSLTKEVASVGVKYRCRPAPERIDGLATLTLEAVRLGEREGEFFETGYEASKGALPKSTDGTWRMKIDTSALDERDAIFCFRLRAWSDDNALVAEAFSPLFRVGDEIPDSEPEVSAAASIAAARVVAYGAKSDFDPAALREPTLTIGTGTTAAESRAIAPIVVRFGSAPVASRIRVSRVLAMLERETLTDPAQLGRYEIQLGESEVANVITFGGQLSEEFLERRASLFELMRSSQMQIADENALGPIVALADLSKMSDEIHDYVDAWTRGFDGADKETLSALLSVDQVTVLDGAREVGRLVGPTHPLRLLWLTKYQRVLEDWVANADADEREARELGRTLQTLYPANVPHILVSEQRRSLREVQPIDLYWSIFGSPSAADASTLATRVRAWLRMEETPTATVSADQIVQRIRRYLVAHPYVELLVLNFVQPGAGNLVLDTLLRLQDAPQTQHLRYSIRLFSHELSRTELGRAIDDFMVEPDVVMMSRKQAADAFLASNEDPLAPKLTYSKHDLDDLLAAPEDHPAHISFFLDSFDLEVVAAPPIADRRSFFGSNLIVEPAVVYRAPDAHLDPQWDEYVVASVDSPDPLVSAYAHTEYATGQILDAPPRTLVPVLRLGLDRVTRAVLDAVHRSSDWVVVIDPVFSDEYLDAPAGSGESPRFLIDYTAPAAFETGRRVVVSTRSRAELQRLLEPVLAEHQLELPTDRVDALLDGLQLLGSGLGLKLLNNRTQALEALSLGLGAMHLAEHGVLRHAVAIPLDLHQDLFREGRERDPIDIARLSRTDLAVVQIDPEARHFGVHLVELKARSGSANLEDILGDARVQLDNSKKVLRSRLFGADLRTTPGSLAAALQVRRLSTMLSHYLERAARYGLIEDEALEDARRFLTELDGSYSVGFDKHVLLFDLAGESRTAERRDDVRVVQIGREEIVDLLNRLQTPMETILVPEHEAVLTVFGDEVAAEEEVAPVGAEGEPGETEAAGEPPEENVSDDGETSIDVDAQIDGPEPDSVEIIGASPTVAQFGIIGSIASSGTHVAVDLDGTNVISVFGVQGSGKSYTVGSLLEAALIEEPALNRLPRPLGGIVFHYTTDLSYAPEFASMGAPNTAAAEIDRLRTEYGAEPRGIDEVVVLVPDALVGERRREFPDLRVEPLVLAPDELNLNDWRLLMGLDGGEQMYARSMNNVFRKLRGSVSIEALREAVDESGMTPNQKNLANTRIEFAESFVHDEGGVAHHVAPGRLVIVDVRDELIEQDEALAVFMVLLNRFGQVANEEQRFNKIIVFDEAHKYMSNTKLTNAIVDNVRLMRHRGTTVVIASQDPPSLPKEVIELSTIVVAHRFTSPKWLEHVRKVNAAFGEAAMQPSQLARLAPGEAFVWSVGGAESFRRPQRLILRPRLSLHGGATRRAT